MLSIENPPLDPHLKPTDDAHDDDDGDRFKASSSSQIDLFKSDFNDNHNNNNSPPPRFSIRDYVCSARSKDIATNWPFSEKNLQLCRKHGVTNLLPPFQSLDLVREQSIKGCAINRNLLDQPYLSNPDSKTTRQSHQYESIFVNGASCNQKLKSDCLHNTSSVSDQGEVPSEVEQYYSRKDSEAAILLDTLTTKQVEGTILQETCKTDIITQQEPTVKKTRVILKLGTSAGTSTKEDSPIHSFMVSEIMASKVCPICKTFSSSSNTTLNAHIDQCLSGESTIKCSTDPKVSRCSTDPKVIKHRIKPRKMRLMVDVYATAEHCTLEDLDRRNGTNWAMNPTPVDQSSELCVKERVERMPSGGIEETGHEEGEVYIDTNGTKVRILSKFSEAATVEGNSRAQKEDEGSKFLIDKKKKKAHVQKHQKFLKLAPHGKPCPSKPHPSFETHGGSSRNIAVDKPSEKEVQLGQRSNSQEPINLDDLGILRQWVGSKRTGLAKKTPLQNNHQHSGHNLKDSVGERDQSSLANSNAGSNCVLNRQQSFKNILFSQSSKRMDTSLKEPSFGLCWEQLPHKRKMEEFPYLSSKGAGYGKRSMILPKHKKLRKEGTFVHDNCNSSLNHAATGPSSLSNKAVEINTAPTRTSNSFVFTSNSSCRHQAFSSKAMKFTSIRKKHVLTNQGTVPKFGSDFKRKSLAPTRSQVNSKLEINNDFARRLSYNDDDHPYFTNKQSRVENFAAKMSHSQTRVSRIRKNSGAMKVSGKEKAADSLENSPSKPPYYDHGVGKTKEFSPVDFCRSSDNSEDSVDGDQESESEDTLALGKHVAIGKAFKGGIGGSLTSSSNSLDREFQELPSSSGESKSDHCVEVNRRHSCGLPVSPIDPSVGGKQNSFLAGRVDLAMSGDDIHMEVQLDSKDEKVSYFSELDPIPIPGPPGSFLPSPRHMGSDDLQGNSSLTTCKVQFTDQHDHVERDKSDSPISAISDISNPTLAMSESKSSKDFFVEPLAVQDKIRKGCLGAAPVSQEANLGGEQPNPHTLRINVDLPENAPVISKSEQLCCCSRKEGVQGVSLNIQESQLLRRRTMSSLPFPEKNMKNGCYERFSDISSRSERFSPSNYANSGPGTLIYPTRKLASERIEKKFSAENEVKFSSQRDHDSASPSASTPVLRLMGKNLMVVNKDADVSLQHRQNHSDFINPQPHLQSSTVSGFPPGGVGSKDYHSYHQVYARGPIVFSQDRRQDATGKQFDAKFSYKCESYVDVTTPPTPFHESGLNQSMNAADACKTPLEQHEYKGGSCMLSQEQRPKNRLDNFLKYGLEKKVATSGAKRWGVDSTASKEIIIIDDATDVEADSAIGMMRIEEMRRTRVSLSGNLIPGASEHSSRFVNPFYSNPLEGAGSLYGRRPVMHNASLHLPVPGGMNSSPVKWNCNPEGLSLLSPSNLGAPPSSTGHMRPTYYYSPSFS